MKAANGPPPALFGDLPLTPVLATQLRSYGLSVPTPIQAAAAMPLLRGTHTLLHAETGSGKTLAYLLPLLSRLHATRPHQLLVVVPSRELAMQTAAVLERYWPHHGTPRATVLTGSEPAEQQAEAMRLRACPVLIATPRPLLRLVRHLAGSDRLHSRRAIRSAGAALVELASRVDAIVLDEADALLVSKQIAMLGPPRRKSYRELSGGKGEVKAPERFSLPAARAVQALLNARSLSPAPKGKGKRGKQMQLVACSATASYRLREELARLGGLQQGARVEVVPARMLSGVHHPEILQCYMQSRPGAYCLLDQRNTPIPLAM